MRRTRSAAAAALTEHFGGDLIEEVIVTSLLTFGATVTYSCLSVWFGATVSWWFWLCRSVQKVLANAAVKERFYCQSKPLDT